MVAPIKFLQETLDELKKVVWPKRSEVLRLTVVVVLISLIVGAYVGGLDFMFTKIIQAFVTTGPSSTAPAQNIQVKVTPGQLKIVTTPVAKPTSGKTK